MTTHEQLLLWVDLETTQADPAHPYAALLEVGAVLTTATPELEELGSVEAVIRPPGDLGDHQRLWGAMPQVVRDMHTSSGLWAAATGPAGAQWAAADVDTALARWVRSHAGGARVTLAGAGVSHLDRPFIVRDLPQLAAVLTYWLVDVSVFRRMLQLAGRADHVDLVGDVDAKPHRALGDVRLHVAEGRRYLGLLGSLPALPAVR